MSTSINKIKRLVLFSLATVSTVCAANAQSTVRTDKELVAKQRIIESSSCETEVRPIHRALKPAKLVAADWTTLPSTYSHDQAGQRVDQYALAVEPQSMERADYVKSGYRHTRSTLQAGFSADNYHMTEQWGQPVRPYGEWRYPNRPFSVPYGQWGPQLPQVVVGGNQWNAYGPTGMNPGVPGNGMLGNGNGIPGNGNNNFGVGGTSPFMGGPNVQGGNWSGNSAWQGQGIGAQGAFGVGPNNVLPAGQDEYYPQAPAYAPSSAPTYHPMTGGGFQSPFQN